MTISSRFSNPSRFGHSKRRGDATGTVVFTLAGLMLVVWLLGYGVLSFLPKSKSSTVAKRSSSQVAQRNQSTKVSLSSKNKDAKIGTKENSNAPLSDQKNPGDDDTLKNGTKTENSDADEDETPKNPNSQFAGTTKKEVKDVKDVKDVKENGFRSPLGQADPGAKPDEIATTQGERDQENLIAVNNEPAMLDEGNSTTKETTGELLAPVDDNPRQFSRTGHPMRDWISNDKKVARLAFEKFDEEGDVIVNDEQGTRYKVPFDRFGDEDKKYLDSLR